MKVLMVTSEIAPYVKVGGLADVVGSLPKMLSQMGIDVRVICPLYGSIDQTEGHWLHHEKPLPVHVGGQKWARVWETIIPQSKVHVYFIEYNDYFAREEVYEGPWGDHADNPERFAFLSRAAIELCYWLDWYPDIFHCHDWSTGLLPVYLNTTERDGNLRHAASVMTIHNLDHQGYADRSILDFAGIPSEVFRADNCESMGAVNMLKGGIYNATKITTVSPNYAQEVQTPYGGSGLQDVLKFRSADLIGVLNGIDLDVWNPKSDALIPCNFSNEEQSGKERCKKYLKDLCGFIHEHNMPIFGVVSRLYYQKGLDFLLTVLDRILNDMQVQFVILGSGDPNLEQGFWKIQEKHPDQFYFYKGFNEKMAHEIYAGSDFFVMPSRFEPCGLGQLYAMRYGSLPIVRKTGGLADTVKQYEEGQGKGTGFIFDHPTPDALYYTIGWACSTYYDRKEELVQLRSNAMKEEFSWSKSAAEYTNVYRWAIESKLGHFPYSTYDKEQYYQIATESTSF